MSPEPDYTVPNIEQVFRDLERLRVENNRMREALRLCSKYFRCLGQASAEVERTIDRVGNE